MSDLFSIDAQETLTFTRDGRPLVRAFRACDGSWVEVYPGDRAGEELQYVQPRGGGDAYWNTVRVPEQRGGGGESEVRT